MFEKLGKIMENLENKRIEKLERIEKKLKEKAEKSKHEKILLEKIEGHKKTIEKTRKIKEKEKFSFMGGG